MDSQVLLKRDSKTTLLGDTSRISGNSAFSLYKKDFSLLTPKDSKQQGDGQQFFECSETNKVKDKSQSQKKKISHSKFRIQGDEEFQKNLSDSLLRSFIVEEEKETSKSYKRKDQNRCKKIHSIVLKIMKRLGIYELALPYKKFQYRLDYFILLLMLIRKEDHYRDFSKMFIKIGSKVIELLKEIDKTLSGNLKEDIGNSKMHDVHDEKDRIETFIETFCNYIETVQEFNEERIVESTASLFDLKKLKYKNSFILSLKRCHSYYRQIFINNNTELDLDKIDREIQGVEIEIEEEK